MIGLRLFVAAVCAAALGCGGTSQTGAPGQAGANGRAGALGTAGAAGLAGEGMAGSSGAAGSTSVAGGGAAGVAGGAGGGGGAATAGAGGGGGTAGGPLVQALDMNDVTILAPLPAKDAAPVLLSGTDLADDGTSFIPRALFDRLAVSTIPSGSPVLNAATYDRIHLVAVRFDLCDRQLPGACPVTEDGRLRLVFQPIHPEGSADDAGLHAFYTIRNDELAGAVAALRALAQAAPPQAGALRVSPALSAADPSGYATKLRAFVKRYGGEARLVRLTMNAQPQSFQQVRWALRGLEKQGDAFVDMTIAGGAETLESVISNGGSGFDVMPATDTPPGLQLAISTSQWFGADATKQRDALATLVAVENPLTHTAMTVACVGCHVSTFLAPSRAASLGVDPLAVPGRYTSKFDLSTAGGQLVQTDSTIRALGYAGSRTLISQRVANETAQTLTEIEQRFPAP
jgi:hypothetical protein